MLNLDFCSRKRIKKTYLRCIPLCFGVCLLIHWIFRLSCRTTVTLLIRRRLLHSCIFPHTKSLIFNGLLSRDTNASITKVMCHLWLVNYFTPPSLVMELSIYAMTLFCVSLKGNDAQHSLLSY